MVLKLYGSPLSPPAKVVAAICHEMEVPFEPITLDLSKREARTPEHLARNPWGKVPVIDDDGFILYETRAIVRYIVDKYSANGPQLIPSDTKKRALLEQAISTEFSYWERPISSIMIETFYKKLLGLESDPVKVEELTKPLIENLGIFEKILAKQQYIAGDELTIADFYALPSGVVLEEHINFKLIQERPNVARWYHEISSRPSWQKAKTEFST